MFDSAKRQLILQEIAKVSDSCGEALKHLVAKHSKLVEKEMKDVNKTIAQRSALAESTDIVKHVWNIYRSFFQYRSNNNDKPYSELASAVHVTFIGSSQEPGGQKHHFGLRENQYCFFASNSQGSYLPDDESNYYKLRLNDHSDRCVLEFSVERYWNGIADIDQPCSTIDGFIPGSWVADFIAASKAEQAINEIRMREYYNSPEKVEALKSKFGIES